MALIFSRVLSQINASNRERKPQYYLVTDNEIMMTMPLSSFQIVSAALKLRSVLLDTLTCILLSSMVSVLLLHQRITVFNTLKMAALFY